MTYYIPFLSYGMDRGLITHLKKKLIKLTDVFYLLKQKTENNFWLACVQLTVYTCINANMYVVLKVYVFQSKGIRHK